MIFLHAAALVVSTIGFSANYAQSVKSQPSPSLKGPMTVAEKQVLYDVLKNGFPFGDTNHDGKLTRKELRDFGNKQKFKGSLLERKWVLIDTDRNDWLSTDEFYVWTIRAENEKRARIAAGKSR